jgi:hypothetical protein
MKYLHLVYGDAEELSAQPDHPGLDECLAHAEALTGSGRLLAWEALAAAETATTVRVRNGRISVNDGPFADAREHLTGFYLTESRDLNEAIQIAASIPAARVGSVEVRPIRELRGE